MFTHPHPAVTHTERSAAVHRDTTVELKTISHYKSLIVSLMLNIWFVSSVYVPKLHDRQINGWLALTH